MSKQLSILVAAMLCVAGVANAGLIHQYDPAADTWDDQVGSTNLSPQNGASIAASTGYFSKAFTFDGVDDYAKRGNLNDNSVFSVEMWAKIDALTDDDDLFQILFETGGKFGTLFAIGDDGTLYFERGSRNAGNYQSTTADLTALSAAAQADFIHIVGTNDPGNGTNGLKLYVNGIEKDSAPGEGGNLGADDAALGYGSSGDDVNKIGTWKGTSRLGDPEAFDGQVALLNIYNSELSATDVSTNYNAVIPEPATMSLLALGGLGVLIRRRK